MRRPAVFFDRDNTLIVGNEYLGEPEKVVLVAGAAGAIAKCRSLGFAVVVVSNQSGVARGMFTEDAVRAVNKRMDDLLLEHNASAVVDRHEYCPFHPDATVEAYRQDSFLRKPKPGMVLAAADAMALDLSRSWMVGDAPRDIAAGKAAGCRTVLIVDPSLDPSPAALEPQQVQADFVVGSLVEAVEVIVRQNERTETPAMTPWDRPAAAEAETPAPAKPSPSQTTPSQPPADRPPTVNADRVGPIAAAMFQQPPMTTPTPTAANQASATSVPPAARSTPTSSPSPTAAPPAHASPFSIGKPVAAAKATKPATVEPTPVRPTPAPKPTPTARPAQSPAATPAVQSAQSQATAPKSDLARLEAINQQVLMELKKLNEARTEDFSISKLVAGIMQILAIAIVPLGYMLHKPNDAPSLANWLLVAVFLQTFTIALLIMGRQR